MKELDDLVPSVEINQLTKGKENSKNELTFCRIVLNAPISIL